MARIVGFCCNYTAQVPVDVLEKEGVIGEGVIIRRLPCTGRLQVSELLDAFSDGAEAVFVAGCKMETCHNKTGSLRASKRVKYAKSLIEELGMDPQLVEMFFADRGSTADVVEAIKEMEKRTTKRSA
ncbi:Methyl-viologen-reducing hydrogenase, delta subunit [Dissulfuribacter thermophilus]|uniref:Methyl-viologen-reducing hydrogenase, delta subunit n=1 Tax=Dissulfuribacter thermophilus TaxID=1156395 RepID=A0A1B9F6G9_9BACT|nr:hydrogenase iron-sulfur subunit [Dissulfuribacter thermophilus]OCC15529.1 Methyl-viologen-reducing hydrogenase, delta subunit [Dissulfuribacter thermophilus]